MPDKIRIKVKRDLCSGCLSCMTTCSMVNEAYASLTGARIHVELNPFGDMHKIVICQQCAKPKCVEACVQGAITRAESGELVVNYELCDGCRACIEACPFDAMFWNPISEKVIKCEQCHGDPECVKACATGAISIQVLPAKKPEITDKE